MLPSNPLTTLKPAGILSAHGKDKIHGDGKSSTNVLRMQGQLGGDGVHKVRIVSGGEKNLVVWLKGAVAAPFGEAQIRATILAAFQVMFFYLKQSSF